MSSYQKELELRFPEFKDDWNNDILGNISTINKGFTPSTNKKEYWEDGTYPWLSIADMKTKYLSDTKKKITKKGTKNKLPVDEGKLVMSFKLSIGKLGILEEPMYTNEAIANFDWKNDEISTEFMYYYLNSINILKYGSQAAKGITLNNETLNSIPVRFPSYAEQEKISNFLKSIDKKIELLEEKLILYQDLEKEVRNNIFDFKDGEIEFNKFLLGEIAEINMGFTPSTNKKEYWEDGTYHWLSIADMGKKYLSETNKKITKQAIRNKQIVKRDTLVMSFKLTIGKLAILKEDMFTNEAIASFNWKTEEISTEYMYFYLNSINILKYGSQAAKGITLNTETLHTIPVYLPSHDKQEEIVEILLSFNNKIDLIRNQINEINNFKKGLLQKMFI